MELRVVYNNNCCTNEITSQVASQYRSRLLELFTSSARAKDCHDDWVRKGKPLYATWLSYTKIAEEEATMRLTPSTRMLGRIKVTFE